MPDRIVFSFGPLKTQRAIEQYEKNFVLLIKMYGRKAHT